jgi:methionyl aminopeptidase
LLLPLFHWPYWVVTDDIYWPVYKLQHYRNRDVLTLHPGMIFTIEPMLVEGAGDCWEWPSDGWTVVTSDGSRAAQFEHTILIRDYGQTPEILTVLNEEENE